MALETFTQAIDCKAVKSHSVGTPAVTEAEAVQKADEYLQIGAHKSVIVDIKQESMEATTFPMSSSRILLKVYMLHWNVRQKC